MWLFLLYCGYIGYFLKTWLFWLFFLYCGYLDYFLVRPVFCSSAPIYIHPLSFSQLFCGVFLSFLLLFWSWVLQPSKQQSSRVLPELAWGKFLLAREKKILILRVTQLSFCCLLSSPLLPCYWMRWWRRESTCDLKCNSRLTLLSGEKSLLSLIMYSNWALVWSKIFRTFL